MSIKNVKIKNFTVFNDIDIEFGNGVNVIIGENGTGKTHMMKLLYILSSYINPNNNDGDAFSKYFKTNNDMSNRKSNKVSDIFMRYQQKNIHYNLSDNQLRINNFRKSDLENVGKSFIPAKDMLTHCKGFLSLYDKFDMPFDKTYYDIISKSLLPNLKEIPEIGKTILPKLESIIDGKVVVENDTFFIEKTDGSKVEFSMEAEGIKKIAILWQLIMNESITKGSVLFWDEPEANINPSLYKDVAKILLELSRNVVQIFLATHNYNFVKYIEVLSQDSDKVAYHSLYKTDDGVKCETETKFTLLSNNALREDNINLYNAEMKKEFEE